MTNVLFINGWGGAFTSQPLAWLRNRTIAEFRDRIYAPPPVNYSNEDMLFRYLDKWKDKQILVMLSCGCSAGNKIAGLRPNETIPYAIYYSPSRLCGILGFPVAKNIAKAQEVNSNNFDGFNLGAMQMIYRKKGNDVTKLEDRMYSGMNHGFTPNYLPAQERLFAEIRASLPPDGSPNPNRRK